MLTVGHDAAVQTALPLLFGRWTLKVRELRGGRVFAWGSRSRVPFNADINMSYELTTQENRVPKTLWGRSKGIQGAPLDPV